MSSSFTPQKPDVEGKTVSRARELMLLAPCAPVFVHGRLGKLLGRTSLLPGERALIEAFQAGLIDASARGSASCLFPVVAGPGAPPGLGGGLLSVVAIPPAEAPPTSAEPVQRVLDAESLRSILGPSVESLYLCGLPATRDRLVLGRSGTAAAWLSHYAEQKGLSIPRDVVVSADLMPGRDGTPALVAVAGGREKATVVARERPGSRFFLCGEANGSPNAEILAAGSSVLVLVGLVWGDAAALDHTALLQIAAIAKHAYDGHDYARAAPKYEIIANGLHAVDPELVLQARLRLGAIAVHRGRPEDAASWFSAAAAVDVPRSRKGRHVVEGLASLVGMHLDRFDPAAARTLLESPPARRPTEDGHADEWERIQILGGWRRLHLLEGNPETARDVQREMLDKSDEVERPRMLLDLAWTEIRRGDPDAARSALLEARESLSAMPVTYRVQTVAFLTWYAGRIALLGGSVDGLSDLLTKAAVDGLLGDTMLQDAPRWRVAALRGVWHGSETEVENLVERSTAFQRWHIGVFLLEAGASTAVAARCLQGMDLARMPELAAARDRLVISHDEGPRRYIIARAVY